VGNGLSAILGLAKFARPSKRLVSPEAPLQGVGLSRNCPQQIVTKPLGKGPTWLGINKTQVSARSLA
jgi:hypothetical protein